MPQAIRSRSRLSLLLGGISLCASLGVGVLIARGQSSETPMKVAPPAALTVAAPVMAAQAAQPVPGSLMPEPPKAIADALAAQAKGIAEIEASLADIKPEAAKPKKKHHKPRPVDFGELDGY